MAIEPDVTLLSDERAEPDTAPPALVPEGLIPDNAGNVLRVTADATMIQYLGKKYAIPPIPFRVGVELQELSIRAEEMAKHDSTTARAEYVKILQAMADVIFAICVPLSPIRRLRKRLHLLRNPLRHASDAEVSQLAAFFFKRRMMSSVRFL